MSNESVPKSAKPRELARRRRLGPPRPGFAGEGHAAIEVIAPLALVETDPFVLLMDDRLDFAPGRRIGGPHPHAGLETVTFVVEGSVDDRDEGTLGPGDVAWMTAGRGVIHNEAVRARGPTRVLQLWLTLAERQRAAHPRLDLLRASEMPVFRGAGVEARLYSGRTNGLSSSTRNHVPVTLVDVRLEPGAAFEQELPASYNGFLLPLAGSVRVGSTPEPLGSGEVGWIDRPGGSDATELRLVAESEGARVLLYAAEPQNEPTVQQGPFVAGSPEAIQRMYHDYHAGLFTRLSELGRARSPAQAGEKQGEPHALDRR